MHEYVNRLSMCQHMFVNMCAHCCLLPYAYMMQCVFVCVHVQAPGNWTYVVCDSQPFCQIKTCQPCNPTLGYFPTVPPPPPPLFSSILSLLSLYPCCSLKQAPALISQKNNWEVCRLQYSGSPLPPSRSLQQCQHPYLYHRLSSFFFYLSV